MFKSFFIVFFYIKFPIPPLSMHHTRPYLKSLILILLKCGVESLVKSVKSSLKTVLKDQVLKEETLQTVLCETEYIINSRPLTHVSADPKDSSPLTPNDLLLGKKEIDTVPWSFRPFRN